MKVTWKLPDGSEISADVREGLSMMEAAVLNNVPNVIGECGGSLSCATCHVYVDAGWREAVGDPSMFEEDMLEMADAEVKPESRLSCQISASDALDGLVLIVPEA